MAGPSRGGSRPTEIPAIEIDHIETPSPLNPLGIKGAGEAGVIPVGAVLAAAIEEALGVPITEMPLSPLKLFELFTSPPRGEVGRLA
jgi:aerobic carbon-monoxide dehydrogenase large subunit